MGLLASLRNVYRLCNQSADAHISSRPQGKALRIDVALSPEEVERDLASLHARMHRPGDALHALPLLPIAYPGLQCRYREADGEHYIYVEDRQQNRLAGVTVFNRLIELSRTQDPHLRATHSRYARDYQRRGIATAIYRWWLDGGHCLISGARQSVAAHALWHKLAGSYALFYIHLRDKHLTYLGQKVTHRTLEDLHTRMILLGRGGNLGEFTQKTGMRIPPDVADMGARSMPFPASLPHSSTNCGR